MLSYRRSAKRREPYFHACLIHGALEDDDLEGRECAKFDLGIRLIQGDLGLERRASGEQQEQIKERKARVYFHGGLLWIEKDRGMIRGPAREKAGATPPATRPNILAVIGRDNSGR